jgi:hypothetical protein
VVAVSTTNGKKVDAVNGEAQENDGAESEIADESEIDEFGEAAEEEILEETLEEDI